MTGLLPEFICDVERQYRETNNACANVSRYVVTRSVLRLVDELVLADPRHHRAQLAADLLDRMLRLQLAGGLQLGIADAVVEHEVAHETALLDVREHAAHLGLGLVGDDARPGLVVTV